MSKIGPISSARIATLDPTMVVYAVQANVSIIQVFLAGFLPGFLVMALYSGYIVIWSLAVLPAPFVAVSFFAPGDPNGVLVPSKV